MSHFYGRLQGRGQEVTRTGYKSTGVTAEATGWNIGGKVRVQYNEQLKTDIIKFYRTKGSNKHNSSELVDAFAIIEGQWVCLDTSYSEIII